MFTRVKGTQDFLDMTLFNFLVDSAKKHMALYNFAEIKTPTIEYTELFKRSLGNETDVVTKEMYTLESQDESLCLRPEATASCIRAFVNGGVQTVPWKIFTWGSIFRHERPQKGRYREFHQFNMEIIGAQSIAQDVHFIKMLERFFQDTLKFPHYALLINYLGNESDRQNFKKVLHDYLSKLQDEICATCTIRKEKNILRVFDCKNQTCSELYKKAPYITDHLSAESAAEFTELKHMLEDLSVPYSHVPTLVRGLDYYDKTVFEFVSTDLGAQNAFCSGGRYNSLVKQIGSKVDYPSIGAAMGIERMLLMLEAQKEQIESGNKEKLFVVIPLETQQKVLALLVADELQANGFKAEILLEDDSLKSKMRQANKLGAQYAILIGPDEVAQKMIIIKDMENASEQRVHQKDLVSSLKK